MSTVDDADATVLFAHGNAGDLASGTDVVERLNGLGLDVFAFDYRGYGRSSGEPSVDGTHEDIDAAYRYLVGERDVAPRSILVLGLSMGGGPSAWLAQHREIGGLFLWSTMSTAAESTGLPTWWLPFDWYETVDRLSHVEVPLAILHGDADNVIVVDNARANFAAANQPKRLEIVRSAGHGQEMDLDATPFDDLVEWLVAQISRDA